MDEILRVRGAIHGLIVDGYVLIGLIRQRHGEHERGRAAVALRKAHITDRYRGCGVVVEDGSNGEIWIADRGVCRRSEMNAEGLVTFELGVADDHRADLP